MSTLRDSEILILFEAVDMNVHPTVLCAAPAVWGLLEVNDKDP